MCNANAADIAFAVIVYFQKTSMLPHGGFFGLNPHPSGNSSLGSYFSSNISAFKAPSP